LRKFQSEKKKVERRENKEQPIRKNKKKELMQLKRWIRVGVDWWK